MGILKKTCLVTGANTGLGFVIAKKFAAQGADTILVCRNKEKGDKAILEIKKEIPNSQVELIICDLSSINSIKNLIEEVKGKYSKLDILYNNAAVMKQKRTVTEDGFEMMFQVNYLASFILMNSLLDLLKKGSSPYIINNGRPSYKLRLNMEDLQFEKKYSMFTSFFMTKLCLLFANLELAGKSESEGITVTMIDPGPFKSELVRDVPVAGWFKNLISISVDKAADNMLYHIISNGVEEKNGKVFREKKEWPLSEYWKDANFRKEVWSVTESLIKDKI